MEVLQSEDLGVGFPQPGQPGWFPLSLSTLQPSSESSRSTLQPSSESSLPTNPPSSGSSSSGASTELSSSLGALLQFNSCYKPGDIGRILFEHQRAVNLAQAYLSGDPPSQAPAGETVGIKGRHILRAKPKVLLEQSKKYAKGALEHYNKRKKIKFELVNVMPVNSITEESNFYTHVNFTAKSSKEGSEEQLFFAELQLCSRRQASSGFFVTCCEPLGPDFTVGHRRLPLDGSVVRKNVDFKRCFACSPRMLHPKGEKYIAGHCNIPYVYDSPY